MGLRPTHGDAKQSHPLSSRAERSGGEGSAVLFTFRDCLGLQRRHLQFLSVAARSHADPKTPNVRYSLTISTPQLPG